MRNFYLSFEYHSDGQGEREKNENQIPRLEPTSEEVCMFSALIWIDSELYKILKERHLDLGLVIKMAILSLKLEGLEPGVFPRGEMGHYERLELSRYDFFTLSMISREKEVDPNVLLSYAFTEALLEILRL
ncbi:hypothetical protein [Leptospira sp.]|nr:hypothetical protein [Leptospira sp.]